MSGSSQAEAAMAHIRAAMGSFTEGVKVKLASAKETKNQLQAAVTAVEAREKDLLRLVELLEGDEVTLASKVEALEAAQLRAPEPLAERATRQLAAELQSADEEPHDQNAELGSVTNNKGGQQPDVCIVEQSTTQSSEVPRSSQQALTPSDEQLGHSDGLHDGAGPTAFHTPRSHFPRQLSAATSVTFGGTSKRAQRAVQPARLLYRLEREFGPEQQSSPTPQNIPAPSDMRGIISKKRCLDAPSDDIADTMPEVQTRNAPLPASGRAANTYAATKCAVLHDHASEGSAHTHDILMIKRPKTKHAPTQSEAPQSHVPTTVNDDGQGSDEVLRDGVGAEAAYQVPLAAKTYKAARQIDSMAASMDQDPATVDNETPKLFRMAISTSTPTASYSDIKKRFNLHVSNGAGFATKAVNIPVQSGPEKSPLLSLPLTLLSHNVQSKSVSGLEAFGQELEDESPTVGQTKPRLLKQGQKSVVSMQPAAEEGQASSVNEGRELRKYRSKSKKAEEARFEGDWSKV